MPSVRAVAKRESVVDLHIGVAESVGGRGFDDSFSILFYLELLKLDGGLNEHALVFFV